MAIPATAGWLGDDPDDGRKPGQPTIDPVISVTSDLSGNPGCLRLILRSVSRQSRSEALLQVTVKLSYQEDFCSPCLSPNGTR